MMRYQRLTINAGFGCPNRDGTLGTTGCSFCNNAAFSPAYCQPQKSIEQQIEEGIAFHHRRRPRNKGPYVAYFQSYSGTYAALPTLRERYEAALAHPQVEGLVIGTRPDCVDDEKLNYLAELAKHHYVMIEYGIESCYDRTLQRVGRGHDYACTVSAVERTAQRGIRCGGHLILGLPGESIDDMLQEADMLSALPINALKLHQLQILKGSPMGDDYLRHPERYPAPFALEEYVRLVKEFRARLRSDIVIERYVSQVPPQYMVDPARAWHHADGRAVTPSDIARMLNRGCEGEG